MPGLAQPVDAVALGLQVIECFLGTAVRLDGEQQRRKQHPAKVPDRLVMVPIAGNRSLELTGRVEVTRTFRYKGRAVELAFGTVVVPRQQTLLRWPI